MENPLNKFKSGRIYLHRLGCPKLDADNDLFVAGLRKMGAEMVESSDDADTVIVSTCAFIGDAQAEAVDAMLEAARWKTWEPGRHLYVTGCIPARYHNSLAEEIPEVDGWYGPGQFAGLLKELDEPASEIILTSDELKRENDYPGRYTRELEDVLSKLRIAETPTVSYLKISEGCNRRCAYCAIPDIRGPYQSRRPGSVLTEASILLSQGVKELIVTAEEVNSFGRDLKDGSSIETLLPRLGELVAKHDGWLRVLYTHPPIYTESFVNALAETPALVPYLDFPIEHADDNVLKAMGRRTTWESMKRWIDLLRNKIDQIALRTSIIVGHPGEDDVAFENLMNRLEDARFERLGVFRYSPEEGTRAAKLPHVDEDTAFDREIAVMDLALDHATAWYAGRIGKETAMLVEGLNEARLCVGRSIWDAPDIDGEAIWTGPAKPVGTIVNGIITAAEPYTLTMAEKS